MIDNYATEESDSTQRRCYDCRSLKAAVGWWCTNKEAIAWRGTSIPGVHDCPFWEPAIMKSSLPWWKRLFTI